MRLVKKFIESSKKQDVESCFDLLKKIKEVFLQNKNYSMVSEIDVSNVSTKDLLFEYYQLKFDQSIIEHNVNNMEKYFRETQKLFFDSFFRDESYRGIWDRYSILLKGNAVSYRSKLIFKEIQICSEMLMSHFFKIPLPYGKNVPNIIEILIVANNDKLVIKSLSRYFFMLEDEDLLTFFYNAFPQARITSSSDKFIQSIGNRVVSRDGRIDVLVEHFSFIEPSEVERSNQRHLFLEKTEIDYLYNSNSNLVYLYLNDKNYEKADFQLEKDFSSVDKDSHYYYLKTLLLKESKGASYAHNFLLNNRDQFKETELNTFSRLLEKLKIETLQRDSLK